MTTGYNLSSKGPERKQRSAFALVELLVVIGVLALMAVLALPALARAKPNVRALECRNNLRQWARAMQMYGADNREAIARDGMGASGQYPDNTLPPSGTPADPYAWFNLLPPYLHSPTLSYYYQLPGATSQPRRVYPFPGTTNAPALWHCPATSMSDADYAVLGWGGAYGFFSYAMNVDLKKQDTSNNFGYPLMPRWTSFAKPACTVLFSDCAFNPRTEVVNSAPMYNSLNPASRWRSFSPRHGNGAHLVFLDGQAQFFPQAYVSGGSGASEPLLPDVIWNAPYRALNP